MYEANLEAAARYQELPTEQQAEEYKSRCDSWSDELNELSGHHLVVDVQQHGQYFKTASVSLLWNDLRPIGDAKVAKAVIAAKAAFEMAMREEHAKAGCLICNGEGVLPPKAASHDRSMRPCPNSI